MLLNLRHYHHPTTLADALAVLKKNPDAAAPLAGGTYLVPSGAREITEVVDLTRLGLNFIRQDTQALRIGATTTLQEMIEAEVIRGLAQGLLTQACQATTVSWMRRNVTTIGGEVVAAPLSSGVPVALLALDARLKVVGDEEREMSFTDFYQAPIRLRGAIITEIIIPMPGPGARTTFLRLAQLPSSIPIIQIAALVELEQGVCRTARIAIGAATPNPVRFPAAEARLLGHALDEQVIGAAAQEVARSINPISDTRGSAEYRRHLSRVLTTRALMQLYAG
jgi:carbon-monoxide dehydrogenase medium subunit